MTDKQIQLYGAPWCPDCLRSKQFLNEQRISFRWIDVDQDPDALAYIQNINGGKQIIPTIVFPDGSVLVEPSNTGLAAKLGIVPRARQTAYDLIVVGSGPAGLSAALYAGREGISTLVIEGKGVGGQAGITQIIENYPGFPEPIGGGDLSDRLRAQAERFGAELLVAQTVASIESSGSGPISIVTESGDEYCAGSVLLATGANYRRLGVPGEEDLIGAGVHFCATCDGPFYKDKDVLVIGGGNSGFQEGLFLTRFARRVTILEATDRFRASQILQQKVEEQDNITAITNTTVQEFKGNGHLSSVVIKNLITGDTAEWNPSAAFVFIGLEPNTQLVKGKVDLDQWGFIVTGDNLETNMPGVFAAGDCRSGSTKQVTSATGEGATAALMIRRYLEEHGDVRRSVTNV